MLPAELIAGTSWEWTQDYPDYPQPAWMATAYFEKTGATFSVAAIADGAAQLFRVLPATSAAYAPGRYLIRVRVTDGINVHIPESAYCQVQLDPAAAGTADTRTWARKTLDNLEAFLQDNSQTAAQSISIAGRTIQRYDLAELLSWRAQLQSICNREELGGNAPNNRNIKLRYARP